MFSFLLAVTLLSGSAAAGTQPHIVLILADDLGWADVPWHGSPARTPILSSLVEEGILLERHYAQPLCTPTRSALMTGKYPTRLGMQRFVLGPADPWGLSTEEKLLPEYLREMGYATHAVGKWHLGSCSWAMTPVRRGFDSFYGFYSGFVDYYNHTIQNKWGDGAKVGYDFRYDTLADDGITVIDEVIRNREYMMDLLKDHTRQLIESYDPEEKPLFLYAPLPSVHAPLQVPQRYYDMYEGVVDDEDRRIHFGMVTAMDDAVGVIVESLKARGMWDNTVLIFFSDNGGANQDAQYNYPLRGQKSSLFEGGIRTTAFISSPLLKRRGVVNNKMIHVSDWLPTITRIGACGLGSLREPCSAAPRLEGIDGVNQLPALLGRWCSARHEIFVHSDRGRSAIIKGRWKVVSRHAAANMRHLKAKSKGDWVPPPESGLEREEGTQGGEYQLFDIISDPYERVDLSKERPGVLRRLLARIEKHEAEAVEPRNRYPDQEGSDADKFGGVWTPWLETC